MERTILHIDANSFFASVECAMDPSIADKPVAVVGDAEKRHGIVLTANYNAKLGYGIKTGETVFSAQRKCPELVMVKPNMRLYMHFSKLMREILHSYSDHIEPFGCDENWVELKGFFGRAGMEAAESIRERIKRELGITVSIGVSFNKVFAKLGSDMKKPDAVTEITPDNFREKVWPLPVESLLYVGGKTKQKLNSCAVYTIGDLAKADEYLIGAWLGKNGRMLYEFANGRDTSPVKEYGSVRTVKSVGNSTTCPRDLKSLKEVKTVLMLLAQQVSERLRDKGFKAGEITVSVRDNSLRWTSHGTAAELPTNISSEIFGYAVRLFTELYRWERPIRSLGVSAGKLCERDTADQLDLFGDLQKRIKLENIDRAADMLKSRYGERVIGSARLLEDRELSEIRLKDASEKDKMMIR